VVVVDAQVVDPVEQVCAVVMGAVVMGAVVLAGPLLGRPAGRSAGCSAASASTGSSTRSLTCGALTALSGSSGASPCPARTRRRAAVHGIGGGAQTRHVYVPAHFAADDSTVRELLCRPQAADLITSTSDGLLATFLPFVFDGGVGEHGALLGHLARNNDQWSRPVVGEALVIVHGPDAYITPNWYASKAEHGRAVPTWNYLTAHVYGELRIHDDVTWLDALVRRLTDRHEAAEPAPWSVDDAPAAFVAGQLRAIVEVELVISRVEAKVKMSQNRPAADVDGVIAGLTARGDTATAAEMQAANP
jgi:transcriptional regulator